MARSRTMVLTRKRNRPPCRSMRDNLVFVCVPETESNSQTCEQTHRQFLQSHIENDTPINQNNDIHVQNIQFARVHRNPGGPNAASKTRTIVAKFVKIHDREMIRKAGIVLNKKKVDFT